MTGNCGNTRTFYRVCVVFFAIRNHKSSKNMSFIFTGRICPKGSSVGIVFTHGSIFGFFAPQVRHVSPIKVKYGREERTIRVV